jgi:3-hydroxyisobutyrate dehydrogenase-like beta-hydroxyacid dehydrogenase
MLGNMNLAFIGLGRMGMGIARNLLRAGHNIMVYNRTPEKAQVLAGEGARVTDSPANACRDAEAVITMVSDDHALEQVVLGEHGIAAAMQEHCVHISQSTISTALARRLSVEHTQRKQGFLSAPVFGRPEAAEAKRLLVLAAGPSDVVERCHRLLDSIGRQTFVVGAEPWQANLAKLCGNFMIASTIEAFGEASATLRKAEVQPEMFLEIMTALFGSPVITNYGRAIVEETFEPAGFALRLGLKDVRLMLAASEECTAPMPLASVVRDQFIAALARGQGEMDWSSVARVAARAAGL